MPQNRNRHLLACALAAALLAGCAGKLDQGAGPSAGVDDPINLYEPWMQVAQEEPTKLYGSPVQLAQTQDDSETDSDLDDLFPGGDEIIEEDYDPLETFNRFMFAINEALDVILLKPAAATYRFLLPQVVRDSVRNVIRNLKAPVIFANELWQGKDDEASETLVRFGINSTLGLAGLIDVASEFGYEYHSEDFGQTLGVYGAGPGPYLVLPLFGPSSLRDAIGKGVDTLIDPWSYVLDAADVDSSDRRKIMLTRQAVGGIDQRSRNIENIEELQRDSVDFYARIRSLYLQNRANLIKDGEADTSYEVEE